MSNINITIYSLIKKFFNLIKNKQKLSKLINKKLFNLDKKTKKVIINLKKIIIINCQ